jgi:hypothetical protein
VTRQLFIVPEHEFEPAPGLPEPLPKGETLLWQGSPDWKTLAVQAFHVRKLAAYFAIILFLRVVFGWLDQQPFADLMLTTLALIPLAAIAVGSMALMAWLTARTTLYTITSERIVMRIGIVLSVTFNLPFRTLNTVGLKCFSNGAGDLALTIGSNDHIAYFHIWPHARPWNFRRPQPMLRSIPSVVAVANMLSRAMAAATGGVSVPVAAGGDVKSTAGASPKSTLLTAS